MIIDVDQGQKGVQIKAQVLTSYIDPINHPSESNPLSLSRTFHLVARLPRAGDTHDYMAYGIKFPLACLIWSRLASVAMLVLLLVLLLVDNSKINASMVNASIIKQIITFECALISIH